MAAFQSNIDITSGGTYAMDITNGEASSKVASDLNGKMANIQQLLQDALPETFTGDTLPDTLPNGKFYLNNGGVYIGYNNTPSLIYPLSNTKDYVFGIYNGNDSPNQSINLGFTPTAVIIMPAFGLRAFNDYHGGFALLNYPSKGDSIWNKTIEIVDNGFMVYYSANPQYIYLNSVFDRYNPYRYIAFM